MQVQTPVGKQAAFISAPPKRMNMLWGSWRSSKTIGVNFKLVKDVLTLPDGNMLLVGHTINSLIRNVLTPLKSIIGKDNVDIHFQQKTVDIFDRTIWMEGADKLDAYERIEGESLLRAYVDEWTRVPEKFTKTMMSRLSDPGAAAFGTMNPDGPGHYLYKNYILRAKELDIALWHFTLNDNPYLPADYKAAIIRENPPGTVFYDRNILGNWVAASGLVFSNFNRSKHVVAAPPANLRPKELRIGVDYGTHNPTAFISIEKYLVPGKVRPTWYATREYYWDSTVMYQQKTDSEYSKDLADYISGKWVQPARLGAPIASTDSDSDDVRGTCNLHQCGDVCVGKESKVDLNQVGLPLRGILPTASGSVRNNYHPSTIEVDPSAASFILQCNRDGLKKARPALNDVLDGIRRTARMISDGELVICSTCPWLIYTLETYMWDEDAVEDEVVKAGDHPIDGLRYVINSL